MKEQNLETINKQIESLNKKYNKLIILRQQICPHTYIKFNSWCDDDYAFDKTYSDSYKCECCGLYASSNEINDIYLTLKKLYKINKI